MATPGRRRPPAPGYRSSAGKSRSSYVVMMLIILSTLILVGIIITVTLAPMGDSVGSNGGSNGASFMSAARKDVRALSAKILDWLPHISHSGLPEEVHEETPPDWDAYEFWTPIDFDISYSSDPTVTLCRLNFKVYAGSPHLYPMFRDLEGASRCNGNNKRKEYLSVLMKDLKASEGTAKGRVIEPTCFIFHESRVGSTLVANTLASDPWSMVFSESAPAANALLHCESCTREQNVQNFRDIVTLMGRSPFHKRLFFKFQSITSTKMEIALEAFPKTPWAFVYRTPVQTMMSHLDPQKFSSGAPCLRSMRAPPEEVRLTISQAVGIGNPPKEAWCAAHLNMLCNSALRAYDKYGYYNDGDSQGVVDASDSNKRQRGLLINYESLPGIVARILLPMFGIVPTSKWLQKMSEESGQYSKGRGSSRAFSGDSEDKEARSTISIQKYAKSILLPTYEKMSAISFEIVQRIAPQEYNSLPTAEDGSGGKEWKSLKEVPLQPTREMITGATKGRSWRGLGTEGLFLSQGDATGDGDASDARGDSKSHLRGGHSEFEKNVRRNFAPWVPFSTTHTSRPFNATVDCPATPPPGYPFTYKMTDILANWNTDNTEIPPFHYDSLCHFDYQNEADNAKAWAYRAAEVPFVVYNIPEVDSVVKKWNNVDYLHAKLGRKSYRTETSKDNHFMYWHGNLGGYRNKDGTRWKPPTDIIAEPFESWLEVAVKNQNRSLDSRTHQYFRVSSDQENAWLFDELPFFKPKASLFMVDPREQRGIHCRFGMRGVIAEAHFDGSRNAVVLLGGLRRYEIKIFFLFKFVLF